MVVLVLVQAGNDEDLWRHIRRKILDVTSDALNLLPTIDAIDLR
jgi:hypothetical protein